MVFSLAPSVFAAEGDSPVVVMTADKTSVKPGENVTITYSLDHDLPEMTRLNIVLCYDHTLFDFVSSNIDDSVWFTSPKVNEVIDLGESGAKGFNIKQNKNSNTATIPAGKLCSITFVALQPDSSVSATFCNYDSAFGSSIRYDGETYGAYKGGIFDHCSDDPIKVSIIPAGSSITVPKTDTNYSVSMGADKAVAAGETVSIPVTVASSEKKITGFNAYDMTFTYDPTALTLNTTSNAAANLTVEDNNGTVRVRRYGEAVELGTALTLEFTAKKGTSSTVTLTEAKFDLDANSINFDAPAATIADADTTVTGLWNVTLPDGFRSAGGVDTVEDGGDFTFTAPDAHYDYVLDVTTNGNTEQVTMKGNNSYTIENVTDNVTVTEKSRTAKTYTLKFVADDRSAETLGTTPLTLADLGITSDTATVQYPNNYAFTVVYSILVFALYYSSYHHFGVTVLRQNFIGNNLTVESFVYGLVIGLRFATLCMWLEAMFRVVSSDKVVYLFGRVSPRLSLFLTILLRLIPRIGREARKINLAQKGIGCGSNQGNVFRRFVNCLRISSMLITWMISALVLESDSMRSRGSLLRGRTAFSIYRFDNRDRTFVICMFFCVTLTTMGIILGATDMWYNPRIQWNTLDGLESLTAIGYLTFCTMPMVMELWTQYRFYAERKRGAWNDATGQRVF